MKYKILIVIFVAIGLLSMTLMLDKVDTACATCCCENGGEYNGYCDKGNCMPDDSEDGWGCYTNPCEQYTHLDECYGPGAGDTMCLGEPSETCSEFNQEECVDYPVCSDGLLPQCDGVCPNIEDACVAHAGHCVCELIPPIE